jgi:hypothetical protein
VSRNGRLEEIPAEAISGAVSRVIASEDFVHSKRLQRFLSYVAEKKLAGRMDELKEYNIALAVFDRPATFDARTDTIVRVEARRLRRQLAAYYQGVGQHDPVIIEIPKGGYGPVFRHHNGFSAPDHEAGESKEAVSAAGRSARQNWRWALLGAAVTLVTAVLTLWFTGVFPRRPEPDGWKLEGSTLEGATLKILTARGDLFWEKNLPRFDLEYDTQVVDKVLVADIDGDGHKEVLVSFVPENPREGGSVLCFDGGGRLRWEHHLGGPKVFGHRTFEPAYRGRFMRRVRIAGRPYLLTVANHYLWYPAQVALLDPRTGRVVEEYWHPGAIYQCLLHDLDEDGEPEVLLGAINNPGTGLGHAALAVLKLPFSKGPRVSNAPRRTNLANDPFPPLTGGGELAYALFPLADVSRVMGQLPTIVKLSVDAGHRILVETPLPENGGIAYYLDAHLRVVEFRCSDNLPYLHDRFFHQHLLDHRMNAAESAALGKLAYFPAAPDGNNPELERFWESSPAQKD